jgi:adenylate cyclase class 2
MSVEIEAKVRVDDLAAVRRRLEAVGAKRIKKVHEHNMYLRLNDPDCGLRVRHEVDEAGQPRDRVTFKGPRQAGPFKQREEIEFDVSDAAAAAALFDKLGHSQALAFEKDRETFEFDGCEIVLDEITRLGTFVEVEGPDNAAVQKVLDRLDLGSHEVLHNGYASMLAALENEA